jgi:hypothetical protein
LPIRESRTSYDQVWNEGKTINHQGSKIKIIRTIGKGGIGKVWLVSHSFFEGYLAAKNSLSELMVIPEYEEPRGQEDDNSDIYKGFSKEAESPEIC